MTVEPSNLQNVTKNVVSFIFLKPLCFVNIHRLGKRNKTNKQETSHYCKRKSMIIAVSNNSQHSVKKCSIRGNPLKIMNEMRIPPITIII